MIALGILDNLQQEGKIKQKTCYEDIHMPKNSALGLVIAGFGSMLCFAIVWYIWWMAIVAFIGVTASVIYRLSQRDEDQAYYLKAADVERLEKAAARKGAL